MIVQINGLKEVRQMMNKLPINIKKEVGENALMDLARNLQKRMKYRVPVDMGWLRRSIMIEKDGKVVKVVVNAYYGMAVEEGSKPHKIPEAYLGQHKTMPDAPGQYINNYRGPWVTVSGKAQPFVKPALDSIRPKIGQLVSRYVEKAIKRSKK